LNHVSNYRFSRDGLQAAKYAAGFPHHEMMSSLFSLAVALMHALGAFCLSLALLHQYRWRSNSKNSISMTGEKNGVLVPKAFSGEAGGMSASETLNSSLKPAWNSRSSWDVEGRNSPELAIRDFRSPPPPVASTTYVSETTPFFRSNTQSTRLQWVSRFVLSFEMLFFLLMALYLVFIFILTSNDSEAIYYMALSFYIAQRLPILIFACVIGAKGITTSFDADSSEGPMFLSRLLLVFAIFFDTVIEIPVNTWSKALGSCT
jgi:hypothetical protein